MYGLEFFKWQVVQKRKEQFEMQLCTVSILAAVSVLSFNVFLV